RNALRHRLPVAHAVQFLNQHAGLGEHLCVDGVGRVCPPAPNPTTAAVRRALPAVADDEERAASIDGVVAEDARRWTRTGLHEQRVPGGPIEATPRAAHEAGHVHTSGGRYAPRGDRRAQDHAIAQRERAHPWRVVDCDQAKLVEGGPLLLVLAHSQTNAFAHDFGLEAELVVIQAQRARERPTEDRILDRPAASGVSVHEWTAAALWSLRLIAHRGPIAIAASPVTTDEPEVVEVV